MIWEHVGPSHWRNNELGDFQIDARCVKLEEPLETVAEVEISDGEGRVIHIIKDQVHTLDAMTVAVAWVKERYIPPTKEEREMDKRLESPGAAGSA